MEAVSFSVYNTSIPDHKNATVLVQRKNWQSVVKELRHIGTALSKKSLIPPYTFI